MANSGLPRTPIMLASISDPTTGLRHFHRKFYDHVRILYLPMWTDEEIKELLELIAKLLPLGLSKSDKAKIARAAKGCPRVLKSILKTWCMFRKSDGWTLDKIISESCCI
jgi:Holliday junction resolvasome RuvABC ATP-dependent DNA helicase subunit